MTDAEMRDAMDLAVRSGFVPPLQLIIEELIDFLRDEMPAHIKKTEESKVEKLSSVTYSLTEVVEHLTYQKITTALRFLYLRKSQMGPASKRLSIPDHVIRKVIGIPEGKTNPQDIARWLDGPDESHFDQAITNLVAFFQALSSHSAEHFCDAVDQDEVTVEAARDVLAHQSTQSLPVELRFTRLPDVAVEIRGVDSRFAPAVKPAANTPKPAAVPAPNSASVIDAQALADAKSQAASLQQQLDTANRLVAELQSPDRDENLAAQHAAVERSYRARILWLEHSLAEAERRAPAAPPPALPTDWDALRTFADQRLTGRVALTNRAMRMAKRSVFADIPFVYEALLFLADDYVPMRRGEPGAKERFDRRAKELRLEIGPVGVAIDHHRFKDAYRAHHLGKSLTLDLHLQGSSSRDRRACLRIYFTTVEPEAGDLYIVVGALPEHLDSTHT